MSEWESIYTSKRVTVEEAANTIKTGDGIFYSYGACCPMPVITAISRRLPELKHVNFYTGLCVFPVEYLYKPEYKPYYNHYSTFYFITERFAPDKEKCDFFSYQFSHTESVFTRQVEANVLIFECTPPDEEGYLNYSCYGTSVNEYIARKADNIIAVINEKLPYVYGEDNKIHVSKVHSIVEATHPLFNVPAQPTTELERAIAHHVIDRIPDGSTIQVGVGGLGNAICGYLDSKKDLGIYSEMFVDAMVGLVNKGVINNSKKTFLPGEITCTIGGMVDETYQFLNRNKQIRMFPMSYVNDPANIAKNDNMVSINSTLMTDLTGQAGSETLGFKQYSGTGGQLDFVRGACMAKGGQSFLALPSTYEAKGEGPKSCIVLSLPPGEVVTVSRTDVDKVVTEYGVAELRNKSIVQRVQAMIAIAHPQFRDELTAGAKKEGLL